LIASYDAALQALAQNVDTQPLPVDLSAELTKQIEAAGLTNYASGLLSQVAEMQKQLEALNLLPPPSQGTVVAVTGTAPVVSTGGISPNISMAAANTSTDGYLTSTDWNTFNNKAPATSGTSILYGNGSGGFSNVSTGSGVSFVAGVLSATGSGGTITSVTATAPIASSGGFTPNISINAAYGDTVNPYAAKTANYVLAGPTSGAATAPTFRALVAADIPSLSYVTSVSGTSPVVSSGGTTPAISMPAATASVSGYLTSTDWNTFNNKGSGTVTSVTGTAPVVSSGGATPAISMAAATTSVNGYLTSTDWNTFNGKQAALVSGTNIKTVNGTSLLGSGDVGTITYAYGGTGQTSVTTGDLLYGSATNTWSKLADVATGNALISGGVGVAPSYGKIGLTTHVSGTLPVANGGTNLTSFTANGVVYASSTSALATGSALGFDGTNLLVGTTTSTPSAPFTAAVVGGSFRTIYASGTVANAASATLFTITVDSAYFVTVQTQNASGLSTTALVRYVTGGNPAAVTIIAADNVAFTVTISGTAIRVTNTLGGAVNYIANCVRIY
jgi:hypothetical protein